MATRNKWLCPGKNRGETRVFRDFFSRRFCTRSTARSVNWPWCQPFQHILTAKSARSKVIHSHQSTVQLDRRCRALMPLIWRQTDIIQRHKQQLSSWRVSKESNWESVLWPCRRTTGPSCCRTNHYFCWSALSFCFDSFSSNLFQFLAILSAKLSCHTSPAALFVDCCTCWLASLVGICQKYSPPITFMHLLRQRKSLRCHIFVFSCGLAACFPPVETLPESQPWRHPGCQNNTELYLAIVWLLRMGWSNHLPLMSIKRPRPKFRYGAHDGQHGAAKIPYSIIIFSYFFLIAKNPGHTRGVRAQTKR